MDLRKLRQFFKYFFNDRIYVNFFLNTVFIRQRHIYILEKESSGQIGTLFV